MADQDFHNVTFSTMDWRIPRPVLHTSSTKPDTSIYISNYEKNIKSIYGIENGFEGEKNSAETSMPHQKHWFSTESSSSSSSRTASSGSLLLTPNNLNNIKCDPAADKPPDTHSIASSTHFTLINGITLPNKSLPHCCTRSRQLSVLVITMTIILFCGILAAIAFIEMRAMELRHP